MPPKRAAVPKAYTKGERFTAGEILTDTSKKQWKLGKAIGSGGFGEIYLASDDVSKPVTDKALYVVKIEPFLNGPLFVEIAFYLRAAKTEMIEEWKRSHKLDSLGMPCYVSSGAHEYRSKKYRFMVIPRYGLDLHKVIRDKPDKRLNYKSVLAVALQVVDILEYIHSKDYIHADVKASNLALDFHPKNKSQQLYLLDYGLTLKYRDPNGNHLPYGPDLRKAHNGTLEYLSRDAHIGAFSRRGDLEVLGYNMLEWLCGNLPWNRDDAADKVHKQKQAFLTDVSLKKTYPGDIPGLDHVEKFLKYVAKLEFEETPNYTHCREILRKGLPSSHKGSLYLDEIATTTGKAKTVKRRSWSSVDIPAKKLCGTEEMESPKRSTRTTKKVKDFNWARVLSTDPEKIVRAAGSLSQNGDKNDVNGLKPPSPTIENPTPAMLQILSKKKENIRSPIKSKGVEPEGTDTLTPAMKEVLMRRKRTAPTAAKRKAAAQSKPDLLPSTTRSRRNRNNN